MQSKLGGVVKKQNNPSVSYADSSLYTREPRETAHRSLKQAKKTGRSVAGYSAERIVSAGELTPWYTDDSVYVGEYSSDIVMTPNSVSVIKLMRAE